MDRLTSMAVFVKAVDLGSFAAAAAALGLSGPMVGKHVRFLEDRVWPTWRRMAATLAIRTGALEDRAGVMARRVARQRMIVCASPAYLDRHGRPRRVEDLAAHQAILYSRSGRPGPWLFPRDGEPPAAVTPVSRFRLDDLDAIADAAVAGLGLAWLPSWLVRDRIQAGALVPLLPDQPEFLYDGHALWPQTPHLPLKVRVAIDALAAALPGLM
ncbi:LysR family transcriptional regulator [Roseomonas hellenica]|uniref:LysR family transcriptional regulator n=1 Tax=Plastoroseomonas hellenica TaxID=2687306 RepID=A0ABS5EZ28_9PROT|nr:LysR substrate-binding domain-containing protein [Plastoroseomonas hellenica]MBR0665548.1 LysR family transcriptional regulator [Plastoroseomonas hellenica]